VFSETKRTRDSNECLSRKRQLEWDVEVTEGKVRCHDVFPRYAGWHSISVCVINGAASHRNAFPFTILQKRIVQERFHLINGRSELM
jgi:hypothetical protein